MAVKPLVTWGDPELYRVSQAVTDFDQPELQQLIQDMRDTMHKAGGIGIAAPQIGVLQRVAIIGFEQSERYPNKTPIAEQVLINPRVEYLSDTTQANWEGCLSIPDMRGLVSRCDHIRYHYQDLLGQQHSEEAKGFHAVVVQHECDHLDGVIFPMRIDNLRDFGPQKIVSQREDYF